MTNSTLYRLRLVCILTYLSLCIPNTNGQPLFPVVVDSLSRNPLANVTIFDRSGKFIGSTTQNGNITCASDADYPLTLRLLGFEDTTIRAAENDTIFLQESHTQLPEVVVLSKQKKMLHILAYIREYATLSTYTDTVTLFREKLVDFMLPTDNNTRYQGWRFPRILSTKSYYRFTNSSGLDSVSDRSNYHFTWSDWIGLPASDRIPSQLTATENITDTIRGRYGTTEIWVRKNDRVTIDVNVLSDAATRKWVPDIAAFFNKNNVDFERFNMRLNYDDVVSDEVTPLDLTSYSFNIESRGRGHGMFRFNRRDEPFFVTTYTETYLLDKEFISVSDAKKWEHNRPTDVELGIYHPRGITPLQESTIRLIARVEAIDHTSTRLSFEPDERLVAKHVRRNFGLEVLQRIKQSFGIDYLLGKRNQRRLWKKFLKEQKEINKEDEQNQDANDARKKKLNKKTNTKEK